MPHYALSYSIHEKMPNDSTSGHTKLQIVFAFYMSHIEISKIYYLEESGRNNGVNHKSIMMFW